MASLRAQTEPRNVRVPSLLNRVISFITFLILLGSGWVAVSYLKTQLIGRDAVTAGNQVIVSPAVSPSARSDERRRQTAKPPALVYTAAGDEVYYHASTHLPSRGKRSAVSEETARERGLKPCPICKR